MSETVLFGYWRSSATYRARIALNLKGVSYLTAPVDLLLDQNLSAEHLARHPSGRVPILAIDGLMLGQSMAMIDYLEDTRPEPALLPRDPKLRALARDFKDQIVADIHPLNNTSVLARLREQFGADEEAIGRWYRHWIDRGFRVLDKMLPKEGDYCVADAVSQADIVLVPQVANARRYKMAIETYPNIARIEAALRRLPAFAAAAPENQPEAQTR